MSTEIRRRSLPDSLRWLADKLDSGTLTQAEQAGVALTLRMLADEVSPAPECNCGAPQGGDEDDELVRRRWRHSRSCPQGGAAS